jgi:hypothetical protein
MSAVTIDKMREGCIMNKKCVTVLLTLTILVGSLLGGCGKTQVEGSDSLNPSSGVSEASAADTQDKEGYILDFSSEFNDSKLDTEHWLPQYLPHCTTNAAGCSARYKMQDGCLNLYITKDSPDYFSGKPGSIDAENLLWIANGIQTWEKNNLHPGGKQLTQVQPYEGYATQYGYFEMRMKMPDTKGGGYVSWWLIGTQDDARPDGSMSKQNGEIDVFETFFKYPGLFQPKVHAWDDPDLSEWEESVKLDGDPQDYVNDFHIYAFDWRPEGITFYVDGKEVAHTNQSPQYRMCMLLSMYINSDFSGWNEPGNVYPIEWLIDYVRVYKDKNGYPNSITKPTNYVRLPEDDAIQYEAQYVGDEQCNDLAKNAARTLTGKGKMYDRCFDGDWSSGYISEDNPELPQEFILNWTKGQTFDTVRIGECYALGQGVSFIELQVQKVGTDKWESLSHNKINWLSNDEKPQFVDIDAKNSGNIKALKIIVKNANLTWKHYTIYEIQVFKK